MTLYEFFKNASIDEVAEKFAAKLLELHHQGLPEDDPFVPMVIGFTDKSVFCPLHCSSEFADRHGRMTCRDSNDIVVAEDCYYYVKRINELKESIVSRLNSEI